MVGTDQFDFASGWNDEGYERRVTDVNGDGRADIVAFGYSETYIALGRSDGTFEQGKFATREFTASAGWNDEGYERRVGDVNGDGIADIVGFGYNNTYVALGTYADEFILA